MSSYSSPSKTEALCWNLHLSSVNNTAFFDLIGHLNYFDIDEHR